MKLINLILLGGLVLGGCGGSKDPVVEDPEDNTPEPSPIDYHQLKATPQTDAALVLATSSLLDSHIKNGIRLQIAANVPLPGFGGGSQGSSGWFGSSSSGSAGWGSNSSNGSLGGSSSSSSSSGAGQSGDSNYTDTNVHVAGVDEADYAKYDGHHWYVATRLGYLDFFAAEAPGIQIAATDPANASLEVVGHIALEQEWGQINEMYLVQDEGDTTHLAVIRKQFGYTVRSSSGGLPASSSSSSGSVSTFALAATSSSTSASSSSSTGGSLPYPGDYYQVKNGRIRLQLIDVKNPSLPQQDWAITLDGDFVDSRRIGDMLYVVTRFNPWIPGLQPDFLDESRRAANEQILANTSVTALLPQYDVGDGNKPLTGSCYIQDGVNQQMGYANVINITAIDLKNQQLVGSQCMNGAADTLSLSLESLYLTGTVYGGSAKTVIHKFSLGEEGPAYEASGRVEGYITGRGDPAFRLHEHEGDLRIVTTEWTSSPIHRLFILSQSGDELEVVAQLPNSAQPAPIGKPGEDIYSVRFDADRAYIVTFRNTDPLYAIDLSDRLEPKILGELEIPGFATYMHPLNSRYLFTFGRDADEFGQVQGLKAELIDTADGTPKSVGTIFIGSRSSYSEALSNLKALSLLRINDDEWRIALPVSVWELESLDGFYYDDWKYSGLQLITVTGLEGDSAQIENAGTLKAKTAEENFFGYGFSRSVLHGDAVFFAHNNAFWSAFWSAPEQANGPKFKQ